MQSVPAAMVPQALSIAAASIQQGGPDSSLSKATNTSHLRSAVTEGIGLALIDYGVGVRAPSMDKWDRALTKSIWM